MKTDRQGRCILIVWSVDAVYHGRTMQNYMQGALLDAPKVKPKLARECSNRHFVSPISVSPLLCVMFRHENPLAQNLAGIALPYGRNVCFVTDVELDELLVDGSVRILVMDDSSVIRHLIVAMLEDIGGVDEIVQVADAPAAVEAVADEAPQIAILDIKVPGDTRLRNGIDVLREIKRTSPETDVIMLTNHAIPLYRQTCIDAGASYFFDKSSEFDQLPEAIERILQRTD